MGNGLMEFLRDESGATAIEYGLLLTLISLALIAGAIAIGGSLSATFNNISGTVAR